MFNFFSVTALPRQRAVTPSHRSGFAGACRPAEARGVCEPAVAPCVADFLEYVWSGAATVEGKLAV
eukprot:7412996-Pyramimonas_sp.AAC.1